MGDGARDWASKHGLMTATSGMELEKVRGGALLILISLLEMEDELCIRTVSDMWKFADKKDVTEYSSTEACLLLMVVSFSN